jgi:DNA-binding MarR family transcriptional regulator
VLSGASEAHDGRVSEKRQRLIAELIQENRVMARQMVRFYDAVADQLGLHVTDLACLGGLRDHGPASAGDLATELGLTTGAVTRMIDRLHRAGFVRRVRDPHDGRKVIVELTPQGESTVVGLFAGQAAHIAEAAADLTEPQLRRLFDYVRERSEVARKEADRLRREGKAHATRRTRS